MPREGTGRTALVTGASAGIGSAFAELLASRDYALVLTARRQQRLEELAAHLHKQYGVETSIVPADLADSNGPAAIASALRTRGVHVDFLVNNAGYGVPGGYNSVSWDTHQAFLNVMVNAVCELSYLCLPGMVERRWGRIVNVASLAGILPSPAGHSLYGASKAFLIRFSEALAAEHASSGVFTTALCPGFTYSEFHDVTGTREQMRSMPKWMWMDAKTVVEQGYEAVMRGDVVYINGRVNRTIARLARMLPQRLVRRLIAGSGSQYRKV